MELEKKSNSVSHTYDDGFRIFAIPLLITIDLFAILNIIVFFIYNTPKSATYEIILQAGILLFQFLQLVFVVLLIWFVREYWNVVSFLLSNILAWILYIILWIVFIFSNLNQLTSVMIWNNILLSRSLFMITINTLCFIYGCMLLVEIQRINEENYFYNNKNSTAKSWYNRGVKIPSISSSSLSYSIMEKYKNDKNNTTRI